MEEPDIVLSLPEDIHKICRVCMAVSDNKLSHDILLLEVNKLTPAGEMLQMCASIEARSDDGLPKSMCDECASKLQIAYNFKQQCKQTETNLRELLSLSPTKNESEPITFIKKEKIEDVSENVQQNSMDEPFKGVVLFENTSRNIYMNSNIATNIDGVVDIDALFEEKGLENNDNKSDNDSLDIHKLIEERKDTDNSFELSENYDNEEYNEILSLINERKYSAVDFKTLGGKTKIKQENLSDGELTQNFLCSYCNIGFSNQEDLSNHEDFCKTCDHKSILEKLLKLEDGSLQNVELFVEDFAPFDCGICGLRFKTKQAKNTHWATHQTVPNPAAKAQFTCDICKKIFTNESKLAVHFYKHATHINKTRTAVSELEKDDNENETILNELFTCYICQELFDSDNLLTEHMAVHTKSGAVTCEICNTNFLGELNLVKHLKKHGIRVLICRICLKRFDNVAKLREHVKAHSEIPQSIFTCPICKTEFQSLDNLKNHSVVHLNEVYECDRCKRSFNNKISFEHHMKQHNEPRFLCSLCGKQYFSSVTLACHIRSHNNEKPFQCPHCQKAFSSRATLSVHKRIHSAFKPYVCSYCGYSCRQSGDLAMHIRTHTGQKPYKCTFPNCDRKFTTSSQRKEHYRRHTNERNHKCPVCGKAFLESKTLKVHMLTHTGEKPHECEVCGKKFRRTHHLSNHMKGHR